jgi:hypothetical protein
MLMQQGITAALTAVTAVAPTRPQPRQQSQRSHRRRAATPSRARQQQKPTAPCNRASQHRVGPHRPAAGARSTSAERQPGRTAAQQPPHRQQQSAQCSQHSPPNGHGGPAGHRSARKSSRRTDTAGNSRRLGRPSSRQRVFLTSAASLSAMLPFKPSIWDTSSFPLQELIPPRATSPIQSPLRAYFGNTNSTAFDLKYHTSNSVWNPPFVHPAVASFLQDVVTALHPHRRLFGWLMC